LDDWQSKDWTKLVINEIKASMEQGAIAVKVWKNIGMIFRDDNQLIMIDNKRFFPIFDFLSKQNIPLIGHQGEPKNCWLPVEEMTVKNDQEYFAQHPQYHMYLHPELPSYEEQMSVRDNLLLQHKELKFIGAHLASIEWSVEKLAEFLDNNPKTVVDLAARMGQIQAQSKVNQQKVKRFFNRYQDRILYATDLTHEAMSDDEADKAFAIEVNKRWQSDWLYLTSDAKMKVNELDGSFNGLHLTQKVIDKIYYHNAVNTYKRAFK
jgi:predicted TIM-barrel fold metal-dependent hydrolase